MQTLQGLNKVLAYIEEHLTEQFCLEDLADLANFSAWHFHRQFSAQVGFPVGEYVRKRRLSEASRALVFGRDSIKKIALRFQFESQASFTRALKQFCGCTPGRMRLQKAPLLRFSPIDLTQIFKHYRKGVIMLSPRMEHKEEFTVVGLAGQFTMENNSIPQLWDDFNQKMHQIPNARCEACYGVCFYDKDYEKDGSFTYMAGMAVTQVLLPQGMISRTIPANEYAVFEHHGALDTLGQTYDQIYREWLPGSDYEFANQDDFEVYDERFEFGKPESVMEIWIPVKKKN